MFSFPSHLDHSVVSELENQIIDICSACPTLDRLTPAAQPIYDWACRILNKDISQLRHEIATHETDEHFSNPYLEEKDHLLKLPLILLEHINQ